MVANSCCERLDRGSIVVEVICGSSAPVRCAVLGCGVHRSAESDPRHRSFVAFLVRKVFFPSPVWPRSGQTERLGVCMQPRHFSLRFFLFGGLLSLLICMLTLTAPTALALSGKIREFAVPTANSGPLDITAGPDGNLWFTEQNGNQIGRITTAGAITEFSLPTNCGSSLGCNPRGITAGPDGNLWFTEA